MCLGEQVARLVYSLEMDRSHVSCIATCYRRDTLYFAEPRVIETPCTLHSHVL